MVWAAKYVYPINQHGPLVKVHTPRCSDSKVIVAPIVAVITYANWWGSLRAQLCGGRPKVVPPKLRQSLM